ncbi:hypothetical protein DH2020_039680 [Rehmannia glutinosa]|uniref:Uncharacterized protein n=1 Tax=Rehmannia glutinosa TaxID=99300 RepID=A0ABR0UWA5_REHGL
MSGIINKIEETLGIGGHKEDQEKHDEKKHNKDESHGEKDHKKDHESHGEKKHDKDESHGEFIEKMKEKIHGEDAPLKQKSIPSSVPVSRPNPQLPLSSSRQQQRQLGLIPIKCRNDPNRAGQKSSGPLTLRNVMYTMRRLRLRPTNKARYTVIPQPRIILPLTTQTIRDHLHSPAKFELNLPHCIPRSLRTRSSPSVVAPGASIKNASGPRFGPERVVLRHLLLKGANVNAPTKDGTTALHLAVEERRRDCVRLLLANSARADIRNASYGDTPLHVASGLGDEQIVKLLLHKGANKDVRNKAGKTAYDLAAENGHTKLFDVLRLGDNLCVVARKGEVRMILRLLENGALINGRDQNGWTALHRAAFKGRADAARALIEKGIDVNAKDVDGYTALHCAVESGQADLIELLVKKGVDLEARTNKGVTALQIAESLQYSGIIRILMNGGATKDSVSSEKNSGFFGKGIVGREMDIGTVKKKAARGGGVRRGSLDRINRSNTIEVINKDNIITQFKKFQTSSAREKLREKYRNIISC